MRGVEHGSASSGGAQHRPTLAALGEHVWAERFTASLNAIFDGLQAARCAGSIELLI
jgi:TolB-like protein